VNAAWATVLAVGAGTIVLKSIGPVGLAGRELPPRLADLLSMVAPAILGALVVTETFADGRSLVVDARLAGVAAGACAIALRAPLWVVIIVGGLATAGVRLIS
jgi:branched-subunit amino acid transport protein